MEKQRKSLQEWQRMFEEIYREKDRRHYTSSDLLLHVVEKTSAIAESLRKEDGAFEISLAEFFSWLMAFGSSEKIDMERAIFEKYHGTCPYCGKDHNCICISSETKPLYWFAKPSAKAPATLTEWQKFFDDVYGNVNKVAGRDKVWLHLLEEIGEVSKAFRLKNRKNLEEELADVLAWFFSFANRLGLNLDTVIFQTFPEKCNVCKKEKCQCELV